MRDKHQALRVAAVIPAAGLSSRMGLFKQLMSYQGKPLIAHGIEAMAVAGAGPIVVVTGHRADALEEALRAYPVRCVCNPDYATADMLASIRIGLSAIASYDAVCILPCDLAPLSTETVALLIDAFRRTGAPVVGPCHRGRRGHPPLLSYEAAQAVLRYQGEGGLRAALRPFTADTLLVETGDPGVLADLDTPDDVRIAACLSLYDTPPREE